MDGLYCVLPQQSHGPNADKDRMNPCLHWNEVWRGKVTAFKRRADILYINTTLYRELMLRTLHGFHCLQLNASQSKAIGPASTLDTVLKPTFAALRKSIPKADGHRDHKTRTQERRTPFVMISDSSPPLDVIYTPKVQTHRVEQREKGNDGESPRGSQRNGVAKVEQSSGDGAEDD